MKDKSTQMSVAVKNVGDGIFAKPLGEFRYFLMLLLAFLALYTMSWHSVARAESTRDWTPPQVLFEPEDTGQQYHVLAPSLVTDQYGTAHYAWLSYPEGNDNGAGWAYYYSKWDGLHWTKPVDIIAAAGDVTLGYPVLVPVGPDKIYLFWGSIDQIWLSWARLDSNQSVHAWSTPRPIISTGHAISAPIDLAVSDDGAFHLVYTLVPGDVFYTVSHDQGITWSKAQAISSVGTDATAHIPKIGVLGQNLFVGWTERLLPDGTVSRGVYFSTSRDSGDTWSAPEQLAGEYNADVNILTKAPDRVYRTWNGGVGAGGRYLQWSSDSGRTWSRPQRITDSIGQAGYASLATDSLGRLHILTANGEYVRWQDGNLTPPVQLGLKDNERSRLTVLRGNSAVAVWPMVRFPITDSKIYYSSLQIDAPALNTATRAEPTAVTPQPSMSPAPQRAPPTPEATALPIVFPDKVEQRNIPPLLIGSASAIAVIILILAAKYWLPRAKR